MKLNESRKQKIQRQNSWQWVKHAKLYSDVLLGIKQRTFHSSEFSAKGTLLPASAMPTAETVGSRKSTMSRFYFVKCLFMYTCRPVSVFCFFHCHSCYYYHCLLLICTALGGYSNVEKRLINFIYYNYYYCYYCTQNMTVLNTLSHYLLYAAIYNTLNSMQQAVKKNEVSEHHKPSYSSR